MGFENVLDTVNEFVASFAWATALISLAALTTLIFGAVAGIIKPLWRFGLSISKRKIFIFAVGDIGDDIKRDLEKSGIIKAKNIEIHSSRFSAELQNATLAVIHYSSFEKEFESMLNLKMSRCGLIVYHPEFGKRIPNDIMEKISKLQNVMVVNFRGRLVNDALATMMSTSFTKRDAKKTI